MLAVIHPIGYAGSRRRGMLRVEFDREVDGRWIAEVAALPGVLAYGATQAEARDRVEALALRVLADRLELGEPRPQAAAAISSLTI